MAQKFNADLVNDIAQRRVVIFMGAGASKWAMPHDGIPYKDWPEFLRYANTKVRSKSLRKIVETMIVDLDYLMASELIKRALEDKWLPLLSEEFQKAADISRLHKAVVALDPRIILTTNFDKLIENAWNQAGATKYPTIVSKIDSVVFKLFRDQDNYLIKIHGSIDSPENIAFDKTSYQRDAFSNRNYIELLSTLLLTHTFLFIGFSMTDPAVSLIVEGSAFRYPETRPHYIFQAGRAATEVDSLWKQIRKLYVLRYSPEANHAALATQLEALAKAALKRRVEIAAEGLTTKV